MLQVRQKLAGLQQDIAGLSHAVRGEIEHPQMDTWEANTLTRLIDVIHHCNYRTLPPLRWPEGHELDDSDFAYCTVARRIERRMLYQLGLGNAYYDRLRHYAEVVAFRSSSPFMTETAFAHWLVEEKCNRPGKYGFWGFLYPICYGRTVEQSAAMRA
ncbi:hypothetical protein N7532_008477 [Penicillium argentinense]|uniref:Uncharacterized protein n=1 Tax=Penicillium argentinense TaxID=1131581 RepID=A0A9W9EXE0_9EURO|nr:uncharacterized protein N7532_008477 [Penicillium argentinense]KAJ5089793.1 hypothetical protein N7532_008477 [Penicillium argentinense]